VRDGDFRGKGRLKKVENIRIVSNFEMLQSLRQQKELPVTKFASFPRLSEAIEGMMAGELIVVTGATGCGKTLFCQSLTRDLCERFERPLWFSFEMPPRFFLKKFHQESELLQFYLPERLKPYSVDWLEIATRKAVSEKACNFIFIDHLHYVYDISRAYNASLSIGYLVRRLKQIAVKLEIVVFLIAHTTKTKVERPDELGLHQIRDSSLVAQEADTVIMVHRCHQDNGVSTSDEAIIKVAKARRSGVMSRVIPVAKTGSYLSEIECSVKS